MQIYAILVTFYPCSMTKIVTTDNLSHVLGLFLDQDCTRRQEQLNLYEYFCTFAWNNKQKI